MFSEISCALPAKNSTAPKVLISAIEMLLIRFTEGPVIVPSASANAYAMAGFVLKNTLSENGGVTRGLCRTDAESKLTGIRETRNILSDESGVFVETSEGRENLDLSRIGPVE